MTEVLANPNAYGLVFEEGQNGHLLLQERWKPDADPHNSGKLELPGGKLRAFESIPDCVAREVNEEAGIKVVRFLDASTIHDFDSQNRVLTITPMVISQYLVGPYPAFLIVLACTGSGRPVPAGDGSRNARWWPIDEVRHRIDNAPETVTPLTLAVLRRQFDG